MKPRGRDRNEMLLVDHRMGQRDERDWLRKRCSDGKICNSSASLKLVT